MQAALTHKSAFKGVKMKIALSDHFDYKRLLLFTLPSILMMIFTSIYGVVDGLFVSWRAGKTAFSALNFIMPYLMILGASGFMIGSGGSALIARKLGEGDARGARRTFSFLVYFTLVLGTVTAVLGILLLPTAARLLGASDEMLPYCVEYGRIVLLGLPFFMLQMEFQTFFSVAEKPMAGLVVTLASGFTNIILDALLVGVFDLKLVGAAAATAISQLVGGALPLIYFSFKNSSLLSLGRCNIDLKALLHTCTNGSSELLSNISMSLVGMVYNAVLMRYAGEDGVSAYGVMMYVTMIFIAVFIGFSMGTAPIVGFNFGAGNRSELQNVRKKSFRIIGVTSVLMLGFALAMAYPLASVFVGYDKALYELTASGFMIYSVHFLFCGIGIFGSSFFTALNNGLISAVISFFRTVVFQVVFVLLLSFLFGIVGVWLSIVVAEFLSMLLSVFFLVKYKKRYGY